MKHTRKYIEAAKIFEAELNIQKLIEAREALTNYSKQSVYLDNDLEDTFDTLINRLNDKLYITELQYKLEFGVDWFEVVEKNL